MSIDPFNSDHVAFLLYGLDDFETTTHLTVNDSGPELPAASRFLDSLAHLAICKPLKQVVAIGADLKDGSTGVEIIVATNEPEPEPEVTRHLQYIMDALFDIHSAIGEQEHTTIPSTSSNGKLIESLYFVRANDTRPIPSLLRTLELSILRHSFPKVAALIRRHDRHILFKHGVDRFIAFCNDEATDFDVFYKGPRAASLENIKDIPAIIALMLSASEDPANPSDHDLEKFRHASTVLEGIVRTRSQDFKALEKFFNTCVGTIKDSSSWLSDIVSIRTHFTIVAAIVDSATLSGFLKNHATIRALPNPPQSISFTITRASFDSVSNAAGWDWTPTDEHDFTKRAIVDEIYKELAKGLRKLATSRPAEIKVDVRGPSSEASVLDEFDIETSYGAHCECIVLKHLQDRADRPTEFVGVSKLSCRLCQEYFVATAAHMGAGYHTRGSHGQLAMWRCPPDSSTEVRRLLGVKLLAIVKEEMNSKSKAIKDARSLSQGSLPVKRGGAADPSILRDVGAEMRDLYM